MSSVQKYFLRYSIFLALVAAALYYYNSSQPAEKTHPLAWYIFGFFAIVSFAIHLFLLDAENKKPGVFIRRFMATSTLKLFAFLVIIVLYSFSHKQMATLFIWHFLIFYFLFTAFEIASLYRHFSSKN